MSRKYEILENLIRIQRYNGNPLIKSESDSDHVWCMCVLALEYIPKLNKFESVNFDIKEVIYGIVLHDLDEAVYTDIPMPFKHDNELIEEAIEMTVKSVFSKYLNEDLYREIKNINDRSKPLGLLIKIFDLAQAGYKMKSEIQLGNKFYESEINNVINALKDKIETLSNMNFHESVIKALQWLCVEFLNDFEL